MRNIITYRKKSLVFKIYKKIQKSKDLAFVQKDFCIYTKDQGQVNRALRKLVADKILIRIGKGAYAKAKFSTTSNKYVPAGGIINAGKQVLKKFGIDTFPSSFDIAYNNGKSTQIPTGRVIGVNCRVRRKISFNGISLKYERIR